MHRLTRSLLRPVPYRLGSGSSSIRSMASVSNVEDLGRTMPPGYKAKVGLLRTFSLPETVTGSAGDRRMGKEMIKVWKHDGILQIATDPAGQKLQEEAFKASKQFFKKPHHEKAACIDSQSYAGYIASGEEITDGIADYSEIFTVTKDLPLEDHRVREKWPCHGRTPWPDVALKEPAEQYMKWLGSQGEKLLSLIELGLEVPEGTLTNLTRDGWHHNRILRFPPTHMTNGKGKTGRGIGAHTDYGLLVIASQDEIGGLFIRPPDDNEKEANYQTSVAGLREDDAGWVYVPPMANVHTVFLGDMMQYLTQGHLMSTPHKVGLNTRDRFVFAYFHEPSFQAVLELLKDFATSGDAEVDMQSIHYGTHFTNMFMRNYSDRILPDDC